ncbi:unnamed protein product [Aphanomyces euteiches]|uniref:Elongation of fatty acids protein n=1 Tax=Aphanomyces euteiches TaxID=100861 RepID=A0A6G0X3N9_9STRA|nr:hypothetical protein Ae201684_008915 [Aphanomyces euteiches]KAH9054406.1 hypothetical protein Ae201684P_018127 [Aphanomyces euteiches]KAH9096190.1 hypothetical protein LEN26_017559 [Aphanomyces euteiches]KAH9114909.1 hypothetical protein AeMF1_011013 [Aphanomyces euteiches]KAH9138924.1 hypothetical protein AeRB84_016780 [Aphanomyces euteiches]
MDALWTEFKALTAPYETQILDWADPSGQYKLNPMADWPLADFSSAAAIALGYLAFVIVGTLVMKSGVPAINTSALQFVYNPIQIVLCSYMCVEAGVQAYRHNYSPMPCNEFRATSPVMGNVMWLFYISKILDFMDTFFIILGKKWKQLSFLHVYHHLTIFSIYWLNFRALYDGDIYLTIILNGFIHTIMYTYYFVSSHTKTIWWKKYLTTMQLIQFVTMNVQAIMVISKECKGTPQNIAILYLVYIQSLFWLFMHFFITSYCSSPRKEAGDAKKRN